MSTESQTSSPPSDRPDAVAVYNGDRPGAAAGVDHLVVYGHSNLFYWWPVWLLCFILAGVTYAGGAEPGLPGEAVRGNGPGVMFVATLLAVAVSSTVILRGMLSVLAVVAAFAVAVTFAWFGWWDTIFGYLGGLDIRTNTAGYLRVATGQTDGGPPALTMGAEVRTDPQSDYLGESEGIQIVIPGRARRTWRGGPSTGWRRGTGEAASHSRPTAADVVASRDRIRAEA